MTAPNLAQRMLEVNRSLGWVEKAGRNKEQNYAFVQAVDIFDDVRKAYNEHGVVFSHSVTDHKITLIPKGNDRVSYLHEAAGDFTFINVDNPLSDVITGRWAGSSIDSSDKGLWKAITGGLKYIFVANHQLPTGDDPENDGAEPVVRPAAATPVGNRDTSRPKSEDKPSTGLTDKQKALLHARFRDLGVVETASKKHILVKLTGKYATAQMTTADLDTFIAFFKDKSDATEELVVEALAVAA